MYAGGIAVDYRDGGGGGLGVRGRVGAAIHGTLAQWASIGVISIQMSTSANILSKNQRI